MGANKNLAYIHAHIRAYIHAHIRAYFNERAFRGAACFFVDLHITYIHTYIYTQTGTQMRLGSS
jgi:hypothetical protein